MALAAQVGTAPEDSSSKLETLQQVLNHAMSSLEKASGGTRQAGRVSEQMNAREERRALAEQFEELQSSLLTSCEPLVANRQARGAAQVELLWVETDCAIEGVDADALRNRLGDATGKRALLKRLIIAQKSNLGGS